MKVAMINDAASVGETLLNYLPKGFSSVHVKRGRGLYEKTLGLAWAVPLLQADVFHVHYLLQDCYIASKAGKRPLVGHAHGSDLREMINTQKYGWIVKSNLKSCDKVFVAQPTILGAALEFNWSASYLPIPYDPQLFYPKPLPQMRKKKRVFIASSHNFRVKGTDKFLFALANVPDVEVVSFACGPDYLMARVIARKLGLDVSFVPPVGHEFMNGLYWGADLVLGSYGVGQLDTVAVEGMACGRPVIHYLKEGFFGDVPLVQRFGCMGDLVDCVEGLLFDGGWCGRVVEAQLDYVGRVHRADVVARELAGVYMSLNPKC